MNTTQVQQHEPPGYKRNTKRRRTIWLRISVFVAGVLVIAGLTVFNILNATNGVIAFTAFSAFMALVSYASPLPSDPPTEPALPQPIQVAVTVQSSATPTATNTKSKPGQETNSILWNIPYLRNPYFTGRESILKTLHEHLTARQTTALTQRQAISGLGGIGKTQIALEYAYRHRASGDYSAILWVNADTRESIIASFQELASLFALSEMRETDLNKVARAVKRWFVEHEGWLLIFDNADDLQLVEDFLPASDSGALLLTTRHQSPGVLAQAIDIKQMEQHEGTLLLLRRAKRLPQDATLEQASPEQRALAEQIVQEMDGLPLAIDQAAAYIEETPCSLESYLQAYRNKRMARLQARGNDPYKHHPIATTWSLNFEQVEQNDHAATDLLHVLAFLAPDAIPEDLLMAGASALGPQLAGIATDATLLDQPMRTLSRFSLVKRTPDLRVLSIHRLVQDVFKTRMPNETRRTWAERTVRAVSEAFPHVEFSTWETCERYLPHALACATLIEDDALAFPEAANLLNQTAFYLYEHAQYAQAEPLYQRALVIREQVLGQNHPDTAQSLNNLAGLYDSQGRYSEAEPLYQRALAICEQALGQNHPDTATSLNNLATLYDNQGRYSEAEPLYRRALAICEQAMGTDHPLTATSLDNLATLYESQGRYSEAEPLYQRALAIYEQALGTDHPDTATSLNNLAELYRSQGRYSEAEPLYQRALAICEQAMGQNHPDTATSLNNLANLYRSQGRYSEAEPLHQRALAIYEQALGTDHPLTATSLNNLAELYRSQGRYSEAEPLLKRALAIREQALGQNHPSTATNLNNLALLYFSQGRYSEAEPLYQRALAIIEKGLGINHPTTKIVHGNYERFLAEAKKREKGL